MIELRTLLLDDLEQVADIERETLSGWSYDAIYKGIEREHIHQLVAVQGGECICGWCCCQKIWPEVEILRLAVQCGKRRKGIATTLLQGVLQQLTCQLYEAVCLEVRAKNNSALQLYYKFGFKEVGVRPNYYSKPLDNALILQRKTST